MMQALLKNQVALITGGSSGIGRAIALLFAAQGARVIIWGTNEEKGKRVVHEIKEIFPESEASFAAVPVEKKEAVAEEIKNTLAAYGKIDALVNNAGITRDQLLMRMSEEDWDKVLEVNLKSCYNTCHALVRSFMKERRGCIINISSVVGITGNAGQTNYAASKAAIIGFTKALAKELAPRQVRVNCVAPGFTKTPMTEKMTEEQKKSALAQIPLDRMGSPEDIANAVLFLASPLAGYITGQVLAVDGGMAM